MCAVCVRVESKRLRKKLTSGRTQRLAIRVGGSSDWDAAATATAEKDGGKRRGDGGGGVGGVGGAVLSGCGRLELIVRNDGSALAFLSLFVFFRSPTVCFSTQELFLRGLGLLLYEGTTCRQHQ